MRTVRLGGTGEQVSQLALGCMLTGTATDEASSVRMLDSYLDAGGSFLDTADCYAWRHDRTSTGGESERLLGRWLAGGRRDGVFLATKGSALVRDVGEVWGEGGEPDWETARTRFVGAGAATLRASIDASLQRLGTDRVDLHYVHVDDRIAVLTEVATELGVTPNQLVLAWLLHAGAPAVPESHDRVVRFRIHGPSCTDR